MLPITSLPLVNMSESLPPPGASTPLYVVRRYYKAATKQPAPYDEPADYRFCEVNETKDSPRRGHITNTGIGQRAIQLVSSQTWTDSLAFNRAYEKFVQKMHSNVSLGQSLAERRKTADSLVRRIGTLAKAYKSLRRGRFRAFLNTLDVPPKEKHRGVVRIRARQASAYWLEYWFGWAPLVKDVYNAVELLDSEYPLLTVVGSAGSRVVGNVSSPANPVNMISAVRISAQVEVKNEMLYRANQYGVINPALVAWELVPFSFLVDWFIPVGNYLRSFTDFVGLSVKKASTTYYIKGTGEYRNTSGTTLYAKAWGVAVKRVRGIAKPSVTWHVPLRLSVTRAATAISLLITLFIGDRKGLQHVNL